MLNRRKFLKLFGALAAGGFSLLSFKALWTPTPAKTMPAAPESAQENLVGNYCPELIKSYRKVNFNSKDYGVVTIHYNRHRQLQRQLNQHRSKIVELIGRKV